MEPRRRQKIAGGQVQGLKIKTNRYPKKQKKKNIQL